MLWTHKNQYIERLGFLVDEMLDLRGSNFHTPRIISPHFRQIVSFCFSHEQYKNLNFMFIIVNMTTGSHVVTQKTIFAIVKVTKLIQFYIVANHSNSCIKANKRPYSNTETGNSGEEKLCFNRKNFHTLLSDCSHVTQLLIMRTRVRVEQPSAATRWGVSSGRIRIKSLMSTTTTS